MLTSALPIVLLGCVSIPSGLTTRATWTSTEIKVELMAIEASAISTSKFDQYYRIQFTNRRSVYNVPSFLHRTEVEESFARVSQSFGGSSVHFSSSGKTVVIDDDSPGAASSDGHQLIVASMGGEPIVATLRGPERPGVLIEDWPRVTDVTDSEVTFQYDEDVDGFTVPIRKLLENAKMVEQVGADQPATAAQLKSEGKMNTNPESEERPR